MATLDLDNTVIRAPVDSTILERNVEVGEFVTNGFVGDRGAKGFVVSIADLSDLLVELDISQNDFAKVAYKQPCWIVTDAYPDRKYDGIVELISPVANRQKATVQVRVKVSPPDDFLKPDMNATVSFLTRRRSPAATRTRRGRPPPPAQPPPISIPASALRDGAVFIVENGIAVRRTVTTGPTSANGDLEITKRPHRRRRPHPPPPRHPQGRRQSIHQIMESTPIPRLFVYITAFGDGDHIHDHFSIVDGVYHAQIAHTVTV